MARTSSHPSGRTTTTVQELGASPRRWEISASVSATAELVVDRDDTGLLLDDTLDGGPRVR